MIRLLTAAALAALLSSPVMAQSVSPSEEGSPPSSPTWERSTGPGSSDSLSGSQGLNQQSQGLTNELPTDCGPQDPRPECQTAQLPTEEGVQGQDPSLQQQQPGMSGQSGSGDAPAEMPADDSRYQGSGPGSESGGGSMNR